jgi:hypothetical protein
LDETHTHRDEFENLALAGTIATHQANNWRVVWRDQFNILKMPPTINPDLLNPQRLPLSPIGRYLVQIAYLGINW